MEEIKITYTDSGFYIKQGDKQAEMLGWDEMLGTIAALTMPNPCPCLGWMKPKMQFKDGDFVTIQTANNTWVSIYYNRDNELIFTHTCLCISDKPVGEAIFDSGLFLRPLCSIKELESIRPSTDSERQQLLDALHKEGKDWNPEKKEIVDYKWTPQDGEIYYFVHTSGVVGCNNWYKNSVDEKLFSIGNCFKSIEEAEEKVEKFKEILSK